MEDRASRRSTDEKNAPSLTGFYEWMMRRFTGSRRFWFWLCSDGDPCGPVVLLVLDLCLSSRRLCSSREGEEDLLSHQQIKQNQEVLEKQRWDVIYKIWYQPTAPYHRS